MNSVASMLRAMLIRVTESVILKRILILLSIAGFLWQVIVVSIEYFGYKTTTSVTFVLQDKVKLQACVFCARYRDVIDRKMITKETGMKFAQKDTPAAKEEDKNELLTIDQIFKYTPAANEILLSCITRNQHGIENPNTTKCDRYFKISKYFTQSFICYRIRRKQNDRYPIDEVTHALTKSFIVYEILLNEKFIDISEILSIVYADDEPDPYPFTSRDYAARHWVKVDKVTDIADENYQFLSGSDISVRRLPKPYDTACKKRPARDVYECLLECKQKHYAIIKRAPGSEILPEKKQYKYKTISEADKNNNRTMGRVKLFDESCRRQCRFRPCSIDLSVTVAHASRYVGYSFGFSINTSKQPDLFSNSLPVMTFIEYFSFTMGCFGIWFGISFLSFKPRVGKKRKKKAKKDPSNRTQLLVSRRKKHVPWPFVP